MKRLMVFLMMAVGLLFTASANSVPVDRDIGIVLQTEVTQISVIDINQGVVAEIYFCQGTDKQVTSEVTQAYAFTEEIICPVCLGANLTKYIKFSTISWMQAYDDTGQYASKAQNKYKTNFS